MSKRTLEKTIHTKLSRDGDYTAYLQLDATSAKPVVQNVQFWRFHHLKTVERIIGYKPGTGGSSGVPFLKKALDTEFFPELLRVRTEIGS